MKTELRETLGKLVRDVWISWAQQQPNTKPSWLVPWESLSEPDKEVDRRIGERLFTEGQSWSPKEIQRLRGTETPFFNNIRETWRILRGKS